MGEEIAAFRVVTECGQMARVPWFEAVDKDGYVLYSINAALVESVEYAPPSEPSEAILDSGAVPSTAIGTWQFDGLVWHLFEVLPE